jgi:hypothetical protein
MFYLFSIPGRTPGADPSRTLDGWDHKMLTRHAMPSHLPLTAFVFGDQSGASALVLASGAAAPLGRSLERSPKGKQLNLLCLFSVSFFLAVFSPKIACQAPRPPNPLPHNNIRVQVSYAQTAIMNIEIQNKQAQTSAEANPLIRSTLTANHSPSILCSHPSLQTLEYRYFASKHRGRGAPAQRRI